MPIHSERFIHRFIEKVEHTGGCWFWKGCVSPKGYGQVTVGPRRRPAHQVSYEIHIGPIPDGLEIDHLCRNRDCVNPDHLEPVTHLKNLRRRPVRKICPNGHLRTPDNLKTEKKGGETFQRCRRCFNNARIRWRARRREARDAA